MEQITTFKYKSMEPNKCVIFYISITLYRSTSQVSFLDMCHRASICSIGTILNQNKKRSSDNSFTYMIFNLIIRSYIIRSTIENLIEKMMEFEYL